MLIVFSPGPRMNVVLSVAVRFVRTFLPDPPMIVIERPPAPYPRYR